MGLRPVLCRQSCWDRLFPPCLSTAVGTVRGRKHSAENQKITIFVMAVLASLIDGMPWQAWHSLRKAFSSPSWSRSCCSPSQGSWRQSQLQIMSLLLWGFVVTEMGNRTRPPALQPHQPRLQPHHQASASLPAHAGMYCLPLPSVRPPLKIRLFYLVPKRHPLSDTCFWNVWC